MKVYFYYYWNVTAGKSIYERMGNFDTGEYLLYRRPRAGRAYPQQNQQFILQYLPMSATAVWRYCKTNNNQLSRSKAFSPADTIVWTLR